MTPFNPQKAQKAEMPQPRPDLGNIDFDALPTGKDKQAEALYKKSFLIFSA
jgi:hypothetical protein